MLMIEQGANYDTITKALKRNKTSLYNHVCDLRKGKHPNVKFLDAALPEQKELVLAEEEEEEAQKSEWLNVNRANLTIATLKEEMTVLRAEIANKNAIISYLEQKLAK